MKRCGLFALVIAAVVCTSGTARAVGLLLVDPFDTTQTVTVPGGGSTDFNSAAGAGILGGSRDVIGTTTGGPPFFELQIDVNPGGTPGYSHSAGGPVTGSSLIQWDGPDNSAALDPTGLGGIDLTSGGTTSAIGLRVSLNNLPTDVTLTVYDASDATGDTYSQATLSTAGGIFTDTDFVVQFADFLTAGPNGPADFTNVGALTLLIDGGNGAPLDFSFSFFQQSAVIPEPASIATWLACMATAGIVVVRRRRR